MAESMLLQSIEAINTQLAAITTSIASSKTELNSNIAASEKRVIEHIKLTCSQLNDKIESLEERVCELERQSDAKSVQINALEMKINMRNLIIFNFEEKEVTDTELLSNIIQFFIEKMKAIVKHSEVDQIYRMGKPQPLKTRPIFISFVAVKTRDHVFSMRRNLKETGITISEDCPKNISARRKELMPALLGAKIEKTGLFQIRHPSCEWQSMF